MDCPLAKVKQVAWHDGLPWVCGPGYRLGGPLTTVLVPGSLKGDAVDRPAGLLGSELV
jgi:hypothetical protein